MKSARISRAAAVLLAAALLLGTLPARAADTAFDTMLGRLARLEALAVQYKKTNSTSQSAGQLTVIYVRSGTYSGNLWSIVGGSTDDGFVSYVAENDPDAAKLRETRTLLLPNGQTTDFPHLFAVLSALYNGYGDLGGWLGDTCQLLKNIQSISGTLDELTAAAKRFFLGSSYFGLQDWLADADAYCLYGAHKASETWAAVLGRYFTAALTEQNRSGAFVSGRFGSGYTEGTYAESKFRSFVYSAYQNLSYRSMLESHEAVSGVSDDHRRAVCYAVADHLFEAVHAASPGAADVCADYSAETLHIASGFQVSSTADFGGASYKDGDAAVPGTVLYARGVRDETAGAFYPSETVTVSLPARPAAPAAPTLASAATDSLTVQTAEGLAYSIDGGASWQTDGTFTELETGASYTILARVEAGAASFRSMASQPLAAETKKPTEGFWLVAETGEVSFEKTVEAARAVAAAYDSETGRLLGCAGGTLDSGGRWNCYLPGFVGKSGVSIRVFLLDEHHAALAQPLTAQ